MRRVPILLLVLCGGLGPPALARAQGAPVERDAPPPAPFDGALLGVRDGDDFGETPGYRRLVEVLAQTGDVGEPQALAVADALADPGAWRGRAVRVRGLVAWMRTVKLEAPILGSRDVFRAVVTEPDGTEGVAIDFLEPPPEFELQRDVVEAEGVFFRTVRYLNQADVEVDAPYVIASRVRRLDPDALPRRTAFDAFGRILVLAAVAFLVVRVLLILRRARAARETERRRRGPTDVRFPRATPHADL